MTYPTSVQVAPLAAHQIDSNDKTIAAVDVSAQSKSMPASKILPVPPDDSMHYFDGLGQSYQYSENFPPEQPFLVKL
jgi:hypothetical protein